METPDSGTSTADDTFERTFRKPIQLGAFLNGVRANPAPNGPTRQIETIVVECKSSRQPRGMDCVIFRGGHATPDQELEAFIKTKVGQHNVLMRQERAAGKRGRPSLSPFRMGDKANVNEKGGEKSGGLSYHLIADLAETRNPNTPEEHIVRYNAHFEYIAPPESSKRQGIKEHGSDMKEPKGGGFAVGEAGGSG